MDERVDESDERDMERMNDAQSETGIDDSRTGLHYGQIPLFTRQSKNGT